MNESKRLQDVGHLDYDQLLDDLYSLHKNLLHRDAMPDHEIANFEHLQIPLLTRSLDHEINSEHQSRKVFNEAQHHLFEKVEGDCDESQVDAIVTRLMTSLRPRLEKLLREKIRAKVIERLNLENWSQQLAPTPIIPRDQIPPALDTEFNNGKNICPPGHRN